MTTTTSAEILRPPQGQGPAAWLRQNLFSSWLNTLLTLVALAFTLWLLSVALRWVFFQANWSPVLRNPLLYLVGQYPRDHLWRVGAILAITSLMIGISWRTWGGVVRTFAFTYAVFLLLGGLWPLQGVTLTLPMRLFLAGNLPVILIGYVAGKALPLTPRRVVLAWTLAGALSLVLLTGMKNISWLPLIPTGMWGGLLVTLILALGGIILSFPVGVLLALGRRSSLPVVSFFSTVFIEVVRGVPLIGILFLSSIILPLFLPPNMRIDRLVRALAGMTLFSAAYMAENVRGGLAAIPPGQIEASKALGLNSFQTTTLIVLPQALRTVIPPIVGQFISLFKDTTLASGVAVLEFLAIGRSILQANPEFVGLQMEVFVFIAAVFWIFCYLMSYASLKLEEALGVGQR